MFAAFVLLLVLSLVAQIVIVAVVLIHRAPGAAGTGSAKAAQAVMQDPGVLLGLLAAALPLEVGLAFVFGQRPWTTRLRLGLGTRSRHYAGVLTCASIAIAEAAAILNGAVGRDAWSESARGIFLGLSKQGPDRFAAFCLVGAVLAPFAEELFFRGFIQSRLVERWGGVWGVVVTSLLFGLLHMNPAQLLNAFALGLVLGWGAIRCGSIWPGVVAHMSVNALAFMSLRFHVAPRGFDWGSIASTLCLAAGLAAVAAALELRLRARRLQPALTAAASV